MAPPLLLLQDTHLTFGGTPLLEGAELSVGAAERLCLVGRNGSGKSTLLKLAAGLLEPDRGSRFLQPGVTVHYLAQEPDLAGFATALDYVEAGLSPADDRHRARRLLERLGLGGSEDPAHLSGGEMRRCALARALAPRPDILLLDEPTNHLDLPAIEWLEQELAEFAGALVLISHDRRLLQRLSQATVWLDRGRTRRLERGFAEFETWRDETLAQEALDRHKLGRKIVVEEDWVRYGVTARRTRNMGRMAGLAELRQRYRDQRRSVGNVKLAAADADISGRLVLEADGVGKAFGELTVVKELSLRVLRGARLGIVGPNGAGKTTLIRLLTGALAPDAGMLRLGANLEMVTLDQGRQSLDPNTPLVQALTGGEGDQVRIGTTSKHVMSYMQDFLFSSEQARTPIGRLSGGERGRLMLARALAKPSNLLVLDEPTNDLDLETLDLLQEMLADYAGTVLLVSHDRDFLDRVVTSVIMSEGQGRWIEYAGGYTDMLAQRGEGVTARQAPKAAKPAAAPRAEVATATELRSRKLSFKDKHALETLPARMDALHGEIDNLQARLADATLYARDHAAFVAATAALAKAQSELGAAEEQWLELELRREALEQG